MSTSKVFRQLNMHDNGWESSSRVPSLRGVAEEAPGAYKDVADVVEDADEAGLSKKVAKPAPLICVKG